MENDTHVLEINLISAQGLKPPSTALRRLQTYAVAWIDPSTKLRTRIDRVGSENPTWNDKFFFKVTSDFLSRPTAAVTVDIFAVGILKNHLLGSVRFLFNAFSSPIAAIGAPAFSAVQIRRPSGRFHGVLNIAAMVADGADFAALNGVSAIGYRDLMEQSRLRRRHRCGRSELSAGEHSGSESCGGESVDLSDGGESTASSSSTSSAVLKELNGRRDLAGRREEGGILCGLGIPKKLHLSSSDQNIKDLGPLDQVKI